MKKILCVFGTRPEAIKLAPVIKQLSKIQNKYSVIVCSTSQHKEMLEQVMQIFAITPDINLNLMRDNQDLFTITIDILNSMKEILATFSPNLILVHGDTTTAMSTALAAFYLKVPVAHIEAGLRTNERYSPWPEEINRTLIGKLSTYHFSPTELNRNNLIKENISEDKIFVTGNTIIDALNIIKTNILQDEVGQNKLCEIIANSGYQFSGRNLIVITAHRRENFGQPLLDICSALHLLAFEFKDYDFVYPVHLNPNIKGPVFDKLQGIPNIFLIKPLDYLCFVYLMMKSKVIITDSGGIQEEACGLHKQVLLLRKNTERPEAALTGLVRVVGTDKDNIIREFCEIISNNNEFLDLRKINNPYGDGDSSAQIVSVIEKIME